MQIIIKLMNALFFLWIFGLSSCQNPHFSDSIQRKDFKQSIENMYEINDLVSHFPSSWEDEDRRSDNHWSCYYSNCVDDEYGHSFKLLGVFMDTINLENYNEFISTLPHIYNYSFDSCRALKLNVIDADLLPTCPQTIIDTTLPPIYDFHDASFHLGTTGDSIFYDGDYWHGVREIVPSDLMVYVIDARSGNFWKNKEAAESEPRPGLPENWKHGYSKGVAISRSCKRVCWWVMAW